MCEKASVDVNRLSDKLVQSLTVKSEPQACHDVCLLKDAVVKSEKDVKNPAMSEKDENCGFILWLHIVRRRASVEC